MKKSFNPVWGRRWGAFMLVSPEAKRCVNQSVWVREAVLRLSLGGFTGLVMLEFQGETRRPTQHRRQYKVERYKDMK